MQPGQTYLNVSDVKRREKFKVTLQRPGVGRTRFNQSNSSGSFLCNCILTVRTHQIRDSRWNMYLL